VGLLTKEIGKKRVSYRIFGMEVRPWFKAQAGCKRGGVRPAEPGWTEVAVAE